MESTSQQCLLASRVSRQSLYTMFLPPGQVCGYKTTALGEHMTVLTVPSYLISGPTSISPGKLNLRNRKKPAGSTQPVSSTPTVEGDKQISSGSSSQENRLQDELQGQRAVVGLHLRSGGERGFLPVITEPPTECGLDSWECAILYSAVPVCATAIIESAALDVGCAHGDYKCECSKSEELQGFISNEVVESRGVLGGLDVFKALSSLCGCDATAPTFTACPTGGAPSSVVNISSSVPAVPSSEPQPSAEPSTTDGCDDDEPTISSIIVAPSGQPSGEPSSQPPITFTTTSSPVEPSGNPTEPCGEESWACAPEYAAVPTCAVDIIAKAGLQVGCAGGDHKCECSKNEEIQGLVD
ncbi:hypothetical protein QBC45DRAFT_469479 [Copromyces sp. CBS 386.78]|nr:hypothetical protein QBC45DRAFT_469479 [Copromyces sp. CBS 386.78]